MDKIYYLWLQKISNIISKLTVKVYEEKIAKYQKNIIDIFNGDFSKLDEIKNVDKSILNQLLNKNIIEEVREMYKKISEHGYFIVTIEDEEYPRNINGNIPFCYIVNSKINLNNKNVYVYFEDYFSKYAKKLINYFGKIICEEKANLITEYQVEHSIKKINIFSDDFFSSINQYDCNEINLVLPNVIYLDSFKIDILTLIIIIEARYEEKIVQIVDKMVEQGKEVVVVPANIYNKNSFFSNYLIKQGAEVILNKNDLKFILKRLIY